MTTPDLTPAQVTALSTAWQRLTPVQVNNANYLHVAQLHEAIAAVLYPDGITSTADYTHVTQVASHLAFQHSYAGETQLRPPQVAFNATGSYLRQQPPLDPSLLTRQALGEPRYDRYKPIAYYPIRVVERHIAHKLHGTDRLDPTLARLLVAQVTSAMTAAGWTKGAERYERPLTPKLDNLHSTLVAWLQTKQTSVYHNDLLRQALITAFGRPYHVPDPLSAELRPLFQPVLDALPHALQAARFQPVADNGVYYPRPLQISAATQAQIVASFATLPTITTHVGNVIASDLLWENVAKAVDIPLPRLTAQQRRQIESDLLHPWLIQHGYQQRPQWIAAHDCQPAQPKSVYAYCPLCHTITEQAHPIALGRGDNQALPVYAPLCILDQDEQAIVCLQLIGNPQAVKANWARLMSAYQSPVQIDGVTLRQRGMKKHLVFKRQLPLDQVEWVLLHKQASIKTVQPDKPFYVLDEGKATIPKAFFPLLDAVLVIPLQPQWAAYLWASGRASGQIVTVNRVTYGQMAWRINPKVDRWEAIIKQGFKTGELALIRDGKAIPPPSPTSSTDADNIRVDPVDAGLTYGAVMRSPSSTPSTDAEIISVYTVDDGIEDGTLFDVSTLKNDNGLPSVIVPFNPRFPLGQIVVTRGALELAEQGVDLTAALHRHAQGDWGDIDPEDRTSNNRALKHKGILRSSYQQVVTEDEGGGEDRTYTVNLWIITERDRSVTTLLRPDEY